MEYPDRATLNEHVLCFPKEKREDWSSISKGPSLLFLAADRHENVCVNISNKIRKLNGTVY